MRYRLARWLWRYADRFCNWLDQDAVFDENLSLLDEVIRGIASRREQARPPPHGLGINEKGGPA